MSTTHTHREVEHAAIRVLARAESVEEAAPEVLQRVCEALDWDLGVLWTLTRSSQQLSCAHVWHRSETRLDRFASLCTEMTFTPGVGIPGVVWKTNEPVWIPDVVTDENFPRAAPALEAGLHGAFAFPIPVRGEFYGLMEFFSSHVHERDAELLDMLTSIGVQIGDRIESEQLKRDFIFQKALLESQGEAALDGILLVSFEQRVLYWNQRLIEMWDVPENALERGDAFEVNEYMAERTADPMIFQEIAKAVRQDPSLARQDQIELKDGRIIDRWTAPVRTPDGKRLGRTVYYRDITRQKTFERQLQANEEWSAFLGEASALLSESLNVETILERLANLVVPRLADWCAIHIVDQSGIPQQITGAHPPDSRVDTGVHGVVRSGTPLLMSEMMVVPLICRGRALGAITLISSGSERPYAEQDFARAQELASRAAFPIDNARLYEETRNVAQTLQKSFLPPDLPDIPGVDIAARYSPAGEGAQIGGDFYDAFGVGAKRWGLVLGDVSGKGLEAATVTSLARHTIRGAALTADRPSDVLRVLNAAMLEQHQTDRFCTAVYATVEPRFARVRVTVSSGGHPPPYVIRNNGTVEVVECGGTLLGFLDDVALRDEEVELEFGDKLFLYTDGVLDIRQKGGMFGTDGLERLLHECAKRGTDAAADHIARTVAELQGGRATDDVAFILLGVRSSVFNVQERRRARAESKRGSEPS